MSDAFQDYLDVSAEIGDIPTTVCLRHGRFVPCRRTEEDCLTTCDRDAVGEVHAYQGSPAGTVWDWRSAVANWMRRQETKQP
ncbi:MAG TPA: hypothetical protein VGN37_05020 [Actinocatenispora sp.]